MIITVDCGSTNMRCRLFDGRKMISEVKRRAGVRNTAFDGTNAFLHTSLHDCVEEILTSNNLSASDIEIILSSGTLSSDVGIHTIPHVKAPVGVAESAAHAEVAVIPDITEIPILFIPGVKTMPEEDASPERYVELLESMSGEECETYGIMEQLGLKGDFVLTSPGSYTKTLEINDKGQITSILTGMCGEFIAAVAEHTLLRHSLPVPPVNEILPDYLTMGYDYCKHHGVSPTLIKARMVQFLGNWNSEQAANFYVGAALFDDIGLTLKVPHEGKKIVLCGGEPLRSMFEILLLHAGISKDSLIVVDDETSRFASSYGAMRVYEQYLKDH